MKVAVVGAGTMGSIHAGAYADIQNVELVGIVDIRKQAAEQLAARFRTRSYTRIEDLLACEEPEIVDLCLPTYLHKQYVEKLADAKKHMICELPIAGNLADARAMINASKQAGVQLFIAHDVRFFPEYKKAYDLLRNKAVGDVGTVRVMRGGGFPNGWEDWYANVEKSGSVIVELMIHDFDFLRWCFGDVERVYTKSLIGREFNRIDHALTSIRFKNGAIAHVEGTWAYPNGFQTEFEIAGSEGIIQHSTASSPIQTSFHTSSSPDAGLAVSASPLLKTPYQLQLEHFIDCIRNEKDPIVNAEDAYKALEISLAALQSAKTGEPVHL